jgi:hypothetical protein
MFRDTLSPYGSWVNVDGREVWQPSADVVGSDFQPYATGGTWVNSDYGWTFNTGWSWGWAPFHYGRWFWSDGYGWCWWPNRQWAPAWVDWRYGGGYVGWAPLAPAGFRVVVSPYHPYWTFVGTTSFVLPNVYRYAVPVGRVAGIYGATVSIHTTFAGAGGRWYVGPPPEHIAAAVGAPIPRATLVAPPPGRVVASTAYVPPPGQNARFVTPRGGVVSRPMTSSEYRTYVPPPAPHGYGARASGAGQGEYYRGAPPRQTGGNSEGGGGGYYNRIEAPPIAYEPTEYPSRAAPGGASGFSSGSSEHGGFVHPPPGGGYRPAPSAPAQHPAPVQHSAPVQHPAPVQHSGGGGHGGRK